MIKKPTLILLLSAAAFAVNVNVGHAQAPTDDTQQTDQSEEAWRKSKKKTTSPPPVRKSPRLRRDESETHEHGEIPEQSEGGELEIPEQNTYDQKWNA